MKGNTVMDMKNCCVCGAEIRSDLEEFGDLREPVCAQCWLEGYLEEPPKLDNGWPVPEVHLKSLFSIEDSPTRGL